jgi:hypothetical protein
MLLILILAVFKIDKALMALFNYSMDIMAIAMIIIVTVLLMSQVKKSSDPTHAKKFRSALWMTYMTPLFLVPIFRYMLRVPLPREGAIVDLMSLVYYSLAR